MGKFIIGCYVVLFLVASLVAVTQGLECYACYDYRGTSQGDLDAVGPLQFVNWKGHKSCEKGKIPDGSLNENCKTEKKGDKDIPPVCAQFEFSRDGVNMIMRGCFNADTAVDDLTTKEGCDRKTGQEMFNMTEGPLKQLLVAFAPDITTSGPIKLRQSDIFDVCVCKSDNCNPGSVLSSTGLFSLLGLMVSLKLIFK